MRYILVCLNDDLRDEKSFLVDKLRDVISKITCFSENDVNMTKEEYDNNCLNVTN